jgi:acyl dehydratase
MNPLEREPPLVRDFQMSLDAILAFGLLTNPNAAKGHHVDFEAARSAGLRGPVAYALHYYGQVGALMRRRFGRRWVEGGAISMAFIRPVCAGDEIRIAVGEREVQAPQELAGDRETLQVDVYNQLGELVAAGTASAPRPEAAQ